MFAANIIGIGIADDKVVYPFLPDIIKYYLKSGSVLDKRGDFFAHWCPSKHTAISNLGRQ